MIDGKVGMQVRVLNNKITTHHYKVGSTVTIVGDHRFGWWCENEDKYRQLVNDINIEEV